VKGIYKAYVTAVLSTLGTDNIDVADSVRVLGMILAPDLSLEKHVTAASSVFLSAASTMMNMSITGSAVLVHASLPVVSTIPTACWLVCQSPQQRNCSV